MGWPVIQQGKNALITAPTGSGKTLAAFLWGLNDLWSRALDGEDISGVQVLYISPLRALGNDIHRNLERYPWRGYGRRHPAPRCRS
jgi:ATP-dependent Lhr-like helicase